MNEFIYVYLWLTTWIYLFLKLLAEMYFQKRIDKINFDMHGKNLEIMTLFDKRLKKLENDSRHLSFKKCLLSKRKNE